MHLCGVKILTLVVLLTLSKVNNANEEEKNVTEKISEEEMKDIVEEDKIISDDDPMEESISSNILENRLAAGLIHFSKTDVLTESLQKDLKTVSKYDNAREIFNTRGSTSEFTICTMCKVVAKMLKTYRKIGGSKSLVSKGIKMLCYQIEPERVCDGLIDLNIDILLYIIKAKPDLRSSKICSIIAQSYNCKDSDEKDPWRVYLPPRITETPIREKKQDEKPLRILHITDIHYDYKYKPGANANCKEPLCCGEDQGEPNSKEDEAGVWGDYRNCDMPLYTVENMMEEASKHDVDFIYHTGDIINHRVWETSVQTNTRSILEVTDLFRTKFPNKTIYNIIGNHEPNPLNEFAPQHITEDNLSSHWLYDMLAEEWSTWLPQDTQKNIRKGGYYTVLVRPGFRIIALNSNVCYTYNWWLLYNERDPYGQLQWLSDTLYQAENDKEVVHILSHVPSGDKECYKGWSREYNKIIRRFADIIKGQFVGHTHYNELHFTYDDTKEHPVNVAFNGGSFTTFANVNPNYRIYDVNPSTYQVEDYEDWVYNVDEANKNGRSVPPKWFKLYSFKQAFGLSSLELPELGRFVQSLPTNSSLFETYFKLRVKHGAPFLDGGCDQKCAEEQLCTLVTSEYGSFERCNRLVLAYRQFNKLK